MAITSFVIRIIFIALPGILGSAVYRQLTPRSNQKDWEDFREITLFSLSSYLIYGLFTDIVSRLGYGGNFTALSALFDDTIPLSGIEIGIASVIAFIISFPAALINQKRILTKIGRWTRVTKIHGNDDIWRYFHDTPRLGWVFVRDHKLNLTYFGWIEVFSESNVERELVIRDVIVYSNVTGKELYRSNAMYFSRNRYDLTIEIPYISPKNSDSKTSKEATNGRKRKNGVVATSRTRKTVA